MTYEIWYKVTQRSRPKLAVVMLDHEAAKEHAQELKKEFHWAAVNVVKVKVTADVP
jgi:hypothetical protein